MKWNILMRPMPPLLAAMAVSLSAMVASGGETGSFTGTWVANGTQEVLPYMAGRNIALFKLAGHVNLKDLVGKESDYWSQCIGLADSKSGSEVRCTWRSSHGQEIYLILRGTRMEEGSSVEGEIIGGTGAADGITGSLTLTWSSMSLQREQNTSVIGGYAKELRGTYQLP